jgi:hypothetical protein
VRFSWRLLLISSARRPGRAEDLKPPLSVSIGPSAGEAVQAAHALDRVRAGWIIM